MTNYENIIVINGTKLYQFKKLFKKVNQNSYCLQGLYIEPHATDKEAVTLTATNGHVLCHRVIRYAKPRNMDFEPFILDIETFENLRKKDSETTYFHITPKEKLDIVGLSMVKTITNFTIKGSYPNYKAITPESIEPNGESLNVLRLNADLLKLLQDIMQYDGVQIDLRKGYDPQVIRPNPEAPEYDLGEYALITPMKLYKDDK